MEQRKINYGELIEKYRFLIGGFLTLLLFVSIGVLVYKENFKKQDTEKKVEALENRISDLENRIDQSTKINTTTTVVQAENQATAPAVAGTSSQSSPTITGKVNINTATAAELDTLPGVGPATAQKIISYRQSSGGFKKIEDIMKVSGIKQATFNKLKDKITVN